MWHSGKLAFESCPRRRNRFECHKTSGSDAIVRQKAQERAGPIANICTDVEYHKPVGTTRGAPQNARLYVCLAVARYIVGNLTSRNTIKPPPRAPCKPTESCLSHLDHPDI